jgi:GxxExxY protein
MKPNELTREIIGAAIEVHREFGPGKLESAYEAALARELTIRRIPHQAQKPLPVIYKGMKLDCGYRLDALVANTVVVEAKSVDAVHPIHRAQGLTYLKLGGWTLGLLLNFNVAVLKGGIERLVLGFEEIPGAGAVRGAGPRLPGSSAPILNISKNSGDAETELSAREVVAAALEVHHELGPGLLPSAYEACLWHELQLRGIKAERRLRLPLSYKGTLLETSDEVELLVGNKLVVKPVSLFGSRPVLQAELLSQLRLGGWRLGLLINFNTLSLKDGIRRVVLSQNERVR